MSNEPDEDDDRCETCGLPSVECGDYGCTVNGADWYADDPPVVDPEREAWNRYEAGGAALMSGLVPADPAPVAYLAALEEKTDPARSYFATVSLPRLLPRLLLGPRATPARVHKPLRLRVCLSYDGPPWLSLLAQCAWLRGGIIGARVVSRSTS
jgi:hypothetical protein